MTRSEVFAISLKLAAVYLWILAVARLTNLGFFVRQIFEPDQPAFFTLVGVLVPVALLAALGILLFRASPHLAARLGGGPVPASIEDPVGIGSLGLRIAAILILHGTVDMTSQTLFEIRMALDDGHWSAVWTDIAIMLVLAASSTWLFFRADEVARRHFGRPAIDRERGAAPWLQSVAFSGVGLWIVAEVLPDLIRLAEITVVSIRTDSLTELPDLRQHWTRKVEILLRLALGFGLFFGGSGLAGLWRRIREAGGWVQRAGLEPRNGG